MHSKCLCPVSGKRQTGALEFVQFDLRKIISDPNAPYAGAKVSEKTLLLGNSARLGETRFETWVTHSAAQKAA
jgi:hypothetical protein